MKSLAWAAICVGALVAQPSSAATFVFDFSGTLGPRTDPGAPALGPSPFSGRLTYEGGTTGTTATNTGTATLVTDQYGTLTFNQYTTQLSSAGFHFSSVQTPGFTINATSSGSSGSYTGNFSISDSPTVNGIGTLSGSFATVTGAVPEPATWASMTLGLALAGAFLRRRSSRNVAVRFG